MSTDRDLPSVDQLITQLEAPLPEFTDYRRELEALYAKYPDPDTFYTTMTLRPRIRIAFTANMRHVMQWQSVGYEAFRKKTHPFYAEFHLTFNHSAYRCCHHMGREFANRNSYYAIYLPILRGDGKYYWMRQVSLVTEIDAAGRVVSFFNMYRLLEPFGTLQPGRPMVVLNGEICPELQRRISRLTESEIMARFEARLSPAHRKTLRVYREQFGENPGELPTSQSVAAALGNRVSTVYTYNKHILEAARSTFPSAHFNSVQELLEFFHTIFGDGAEEPTPFG